MGNQMFFLSPWHSLVHVFLKVTALAGHLEVASEMALRSRFRTSSLGMLVPRPFAAPSAGWRIGCAGSVWARGRGAAVGVGVGRLALR